MNTSKIMIGFLLMAIISSCSPSLSPFTSKLAKENNWTESDLSRIQFYLSDDVVLTRKITQGESQIISGEIKIVNGKEVEQIVIPEGTPGVMLFKNGKKGIAVSFEAEGDEKYLMFGPNPKRSGRFVLLASEWNGRKGIINYDGQRYGTTSSSALASLMVDLKRYKDVDVKSRRASGRTID